MKKPNYKHLNHKGQKILAGSLAALLVVGTVGIGSFAADSQSDKKLEKEETVYIKTDAEGTQTSVTVSDWLKNDEKADTLKDASDLSDIENVKGDEKYSEGSGDKLTWNAGGKDIYYQGTTDKKAPIGVKVSYKLDGKSIRPELLVGQSGTVTIRFDYTNNEKKTVMINGKETEICAPFTAVTGMLLPSDTFSNVQVTNGRMISEGQNNVVVGYALPGLQDSLNISDELLKEKAEELTIPDYVEVTADVENFEMGMTLTAASAGILSESDIADMFDFGDLSDQLSTLESSSKQLVEGSQTLNDGVGTLQNGALALQSGAGQLNSGLISAVNGADSVAAGAGKINSGAAAVAENLGTLSSGLTAADTGIAKLLAGYEGDGTAKNPGAVAGAAALKSGTAQLQTGVDSLADGINTLYGTITTSMESYAEAANGAVDAQSAYETAITKLTTDIQTGADQATLALDAQNVNSAAQLMGSTAGGAGAYQALATVKGGIDGQDLMGDTGKLAELQAGAASAAAGADGLNTGVSDLHNGTVELAGGLQSAASGVGLLTSGANDLAAGASTLAVGAGTLASGTSQLAAGSGTLASGTDDLVSGVAQLADGSQKLSEGMAKFDEEGIQKIVNVFGGDVKDIADRLEALKNLGDSYQTFTKLADNETGSVRFVIETAELK